MNKAALDRSFRQGYRLGFLSKCAEYGIGPEAAKKLLKDYVEKAATKPAIPEGTVQVEGMVPVSMSGPTKPAKTVKNLNRKPETPTPQGNS